MEEKENKDIYASIQTDKKIAEEYLLHYDSISRQYQQLKAEWLGRNVPRENKNSHGSMPGKPTEAKAIASASYDERHIEYRWLRAVEIYHRTLSPNKAIFLDVRRKADKASQQSRGAGRPAWVVYTQIHFAEAMAARLNPFVLSERSVKSWWGDMITNVTMIFFKLGELA